VCCRGEEMDRAVISCTSRELEQIAT
jgi:hypothetical protein